MQSEHRLNSATDVKEHLDQQDALTGLMNRHGLEHRLETLVLDAGTSSRTHAFLMLDMDQFKLINDLSGHRAGDVLLQQIGQCLLNGAHKGDTIARLGGDEFGILLSNVETAEAINVAKRLLAGIQGMQFRWDGRIYPLNASIGIVPITEYTNKATQAMKQADTALYAAKDTGRGRIHIYKSSDVEITRRNNEMEWAARISEALNKDQFLLAIQRITPLDGTETGEHFEVLLRLQQQGKLITPGAFLPAAERFGLIDKIDRWVITSFLDFLEQNPQTTEHFSLCAINLSGTSIANSDFLIFLTQQISRPHVRPEILCFEVTETAAITNFSHATLFINTIQAMGCRFSLDDFGSGMSSFGYLQQLPVDFLKIDGVFVHDLDINLVHRAMVKAINEIGHAMGKKTIAEFVGNEQSMRALRDIGVDYAQGYYISEPQLLDTLATLPTDSAQPEAVSGRRART